MMFVERIVDLPDLLDDFEVVPAAARRETWQRLSAEVNSALVSDGERALRASYPTLDATAYLAFARTGDRANFEASYFARRRLLNALVLAECVEGAGRFIDRIVDGVWTICEESGWQLPAHNSYVRGGGRLALPDTSRPVIDLFAAETAAQLAVLVQLLGSALDHGAPGVVARVDRELENRLFRPYLDQNFWWMGGGDEPTSNWTAWCTQNVLLAAFSRPLSQKARRAVLTKAAESLDAFLKDYGEDGACSEGVLYYRHAGLCVFNALLIMDAAAPGCFSSLWNEPKIRNIAEFIVHMHVDGHRYFNFADSSAVIEPCNAREFLFGRAVGSEMLANFAAADWAAERALTLPDEINLFYRAQAAFAVASLDAAGGQPVAKPDVFLPSIGMMVARDTQFAIAAIAGDNGNGHNHNDVGNVIVYKNGRPVLIDVGVETYTARTFSPQRYEIWTMQSAYHNLPTFGDVMQRDGEAFAARNVSSDLAERVSIIDMDIAPAYPPEAALRSYRREVRLNKGHGVSIFDRHDGDRRATLSLMLIERPQIEETRIVLSGLATITVTGARSPTVETIEVTDPRLRKSWPDTLYRVLLPFAETEMRIEIE